MKLYSQYEKDIINPDTEMHYAILSSFLNTPFPHQHDFFEIFLLIEGQQEVVINDYELTVEAGTLMLIRPGDIHSRRYLKAGLHINIAFPAQLAHSLFSYLGEGFPSAYLLQSALAPYLVLSSAEQTFCRKSMEELNLIDIQDKYRLRTKLRILIMEFFVRYFSRYTGEKSPDEAGWFSSMLLEMEKHENMIEGIPALLKLTGWSHEHLCRVFQAQLACTPTEYINGLRLNYVANSLIHSDSSVTEICYSAGFENLSHFHHLFKRKYASTPLQFRKQHLQHPMFL